ncbi:ParB/RepB/Spo0J family partition protein [Hyphomonas sp.]|uniref:ParB/RepB/Spo0J family partition protein n=1 Tax=Hyphomonas sp. TaxID=87 RepID=UPI0030F8E7F5|tara:strand:- start:1493 stop:2404 length:912 start_codon:yes stop_codon:yes gene_type:complete
MTDDAKSKPSRLGRGLSALMGEIDAVGAVPTTEGKTAPATVSNEIDLDLIRRNPAQPRRTFDETALNELAESLKAKGVLQAILVRPDPKDRGKFQIIAGERRWRAAKIAGLKSIPALVREIDELELLEIGIIENVQRADLNPIEEAEAYEALMKRFGRTQDSLAQSVGKSRVHIANTLRLLQLPESARAYVRDGKLSAGHARAALGAPDPEALIRMAAEKGLSVRDVESRAKDAREGGTIETKSAKSPGAEKDVDTEALEADLTRTLGLAVDIRHGKDGGELRIRYRDLEQLDDVCRRLTAKR